MQTKHLELTRQRDHHLQLTRQITLKCTALTSLLDNALYQALSVASKVEMIQVMQSGAKLLLAEASARAIDGGTNGELAPPKSILLLRIAGERVGRKSEKMDNNESESNEIIVGERYESVVPEQEKEPATRPLSLTLSAAQLEGLPLYDPKHLTQGFFSSSSTPKSGRQSQIPHYATSAPQGQCDRVFL